MPLLHAAASAPQFLDRVVLAFREFDRLFVISGGKSLDPAEVASAIEEI